MVALRYYNIFISHAWKYGNDYDRLTNLLNNADNFNYKNYSAPSEKPLLNLNSTDVSTQSQIKEAIDRKIQNVNIVIVIAGMYANNSNWMDYEIQSAQKYHKPIIAIKPYGNQKTPIYLQLISKETVNWNTQSIVSSIKRFAKFNL